jgi:hypothetical protein
MFKLSLVVIMVGIFISLNVEAATCPAPAEVACMKQRKCKVNAPGFTCSCVGSGHGVMKRFTRADWGSYPFGDLYPKHHVSCNYEAADSRTQVVVIHQTVQPNLKKENFKGAWKYHGADDGMACGFGSVPCAMCNSSNVSSCPLP